MFFPFNHCFPRFQTNFHLSDHDKTCYASSCPPLVLFEIFQKFTPLPVADWTPKICYAYFKPIYIRLITMKPAMRLLLVPLHVCFFRIFQEFEKFTSLPTVDRTQKIGSPDFKSTYIRLITMKLARRLLLVLPP